MRQKRLVDLAVRRMSRGAAGNPGAVVSTPTGTHHHFIGRGARLHEPGLAQASRDGFGCRLAAYERGSSN